MQGVPEDNWCGCGTSKQVSLRCVGVVRQRFALLVCLSLTNIPTVLLLLVSRLSIAECTARRNLRNLLSPRADTVVEW